MAAIWGSSSLPNLFADFPVLSTFSTSTAAPSDPAPSPTVDPVPTDPALSGGIPIEPLPDWGGLGVVPNSARWAAGGMAAFALIAFFSWELALVVLLAALAVAALSWWFEQSGDAGIGFPAWPDWATTPAALVAAVAGAALGAYLLWGLLAGGSAAASARKIRSAIA